MCKNVPRLIVPLNALVVGSYNMAKKRRSTGIKELPKLWSELLDLMVSGLGSDPEDRAIEAANVVKALCLEEGCVTAVEAVLEGNRMTRERMQGVFEQLKSPLLAIVLSSQL